MSQKKIGLVALTALVLSSMIGSGIFSLPQNMAEVASAQALLIAWAITGVGIVFLGLSFWHISRLRPDLDGGIYTYARAGFGELVGFFSAWGYWLCATVGIVGYLVIAFESLGGFVDTPERVIFGQGNTLAAFFGESLVVWAVYALVLRGVDEAAGVNLIATIVKIFPLILFIVLAAWFFQPAIFTDDAQGAMTLKTSISEQVKNTMLITLWVFTGVEGAAVLSAHARRKTDVGLATVVGIVIALVLYVLVTVLAYGVVDRTEIAQMPNPSMGGVLASLMGVSGKVLINVCLIVSVLASYVSWTLYSTEVPYRGARYGAFPAWLDARNHNNVPHRSLLFTCCTVQFCLLLVLLTGNSYNTLLLISTSMILIPYLLIGAFLVKLAWQQSLSWSIKLCGVMATTYALWIVYAAGVKYLLLSVLLYVPGVALFLWAQIRHQRRFPKFNMGEIVLLVTLLVLLFPAVRQVMQGE